MFAYRHAFHAGNHADVLKHIMQIQLLRYLNQKAKPYWVIDTHAGAGLYDLSTGYTMQHKEYEQGILPLWSAWREGVAFPSAIEDYLTCVAAFQTTSTRDSTELQYYPGSPALSAHLLRAGDGLRVCELHPTDAPILQDTMTQLMQWSYRNKHDQLSMKVLAQDGFAALNALLPPPPRRACVLIDPPYEDKQDYAKVVDAVQVIQRKFPQAVVAIWYPRLSRPEPAWLVKQLRQHAENHHQQSLHVSMQVKAPQWDGFGLLGSGVFMLNPPYTLKQTLHDTMPTLRDYLGQDDSALMQIEGMDEA